MSWKTFKERPDEWNIYLYTRLNNDESTINKVFYGSEPHDDLNIPNISKCQNFIKSITIPRNNEEKRPVLYWSYKEK